MLSILKYEIKQFLRRPIWIVLFIVSIIFCIVLPRENFTDIYDLPSMVYFVMCINLLYLFYGAEEARFEQRNYLDEQVRNLPYQNKYRLGKLLYWSLISFTYYLIFFVSILSYYLFYLQVGFALSTFQTTFVYTFFIWFIPFFFSTIIGYILYSLLPNISCYLLIIIVWFLIMPYNSMLGFIPTSLGAWLINGDPNITKVISVYDMEIMKVNRGYYVQRSFMLIILVCLYTLLTFNLKKVGRYSLVLLLLFSLCIPYFSPFVPQINNRQTNSNIGQKNFFTETVLLEKATDYTLNNYIFDINHHYSKHNLSYKVKINVSADNSDIQLALLDDFKVKDIKFNNKNVTYIHQDNIIALSLPELHGEITLTAETETYDAIAPTSYELIATTPWYPMNPKEALNPYKNGNVESYQINLSELSSVTTNLEIANDQKLQGEAYGPTILKGNYKEKDNYLYPYSVEIEEIQINKERVFNEIENINDRLAANLAPSCESVIVTTLYPAFSANPSECYLYKNEDINQSNNIFTNVYLNGGDTSLFEAIFNNVIEHESWQNYLKREYDEETITRITSYYKRLSEEQRTQLIQKWYKEMEGTVSAEQMIQDMEDKYAEG
ncbi:hypothetical protein [Gracilibacillus ureilyticus]|uniref:hypothetical protein n=1 Tax=Gracilibacillus ureilyticus TaxID=531814 RepID=UPI00111365BC|nr:hypothetical protein [Gracilibacillus ureilyticus]